MVAKKIVDVWHSLSDTFIHLFFHHRLFSVLFTFQNTHFETWKFLFFQINGGTNTTMTSWCYIFAQGAGCLQLLRVYDHLTRVIITLISSFIIYKYGLLTKCEVKMAGYWPSSFFACL